MDNYTVIRSLGTGSFGTAELVRRKSDKEFLVIKRIMIENIKDLEASDCQNEVEVLKKLDHPNIIKYYGSFYDKQSFNIVIEYADGGDLSNKIALAKEKSEYLQEDEILYIFAQICSAIKTMHHKHILHRDLKTQNIFLTKSLIVKLGDFGISKILTNTTDCAKTMIGTPYYMSPELCEDTPYNTKSDIWSLGCVLYEMTTTNRAFNANNICAVVMKILSGKYPPIPDRYSDGLRLLINRMLQLDPKKRPSIDEIVASPIVQNALTNWGQLTQTIKANNRIFGSRSSSSPKRSNKKNLITSPSPANGMGRKQPYNQVNDDPTTPSSALYLTRRKGEIKAFADKYVNPEQRDKIMADRERVKLEKEKKEEEKESEILKEKELKQLARERKKQIEYERQEKAKALKEHDKEFHKKMKSVKPTLSISQLKREARKNNKVHSADDFTVEICIPNMTKSQVVESKSESSLNEPPPIVIERDNNYRNNNRKYSSSESKSDLNNDDIDTVVIHKNLVDDYSTPSTPDIGQCDEVYNCEKENELAIEMSKLKNAKPSTPESHSSTNTTTANNEEEEPLGTKIEKLKTQCEKALGFDLFMELYRYLRDHTGDTFAPDFVPSDKVMYVSRVLRIISYENELFK